MTVRDGSYFLLTDQVGTLRAVADTSGAIVKKIDYDSFGNIIADSNPAFSVPFGFAGGLHDRDTGLVRFGYRDYSPELGRFVAKDPIDFAGGDTNLFAYTMSDPVNRIDPRGLLDIFVGGEGDLVGILGIEGSGGIVFDTDSPLDSGFFISGGPAAGANVGGGVMGGVCKEIEGFGFNIDANLGKVSPTISFNDTGFNGFAVSVGPGIGVSVSATNTKTYTVRDAIGWIKKRFGL